VLCTNYAVVTDLKTAIKIDRRENNFPLLLGDPKKKGRRIRRPFSGTFYGTQHHHISGKNEKVQIATFSRRSITT
jgi:hypothetical protein